MNSKILICVPTYQRPKMVCEVLNYEIDYYKKAGIDVCYYDSSHDDESKKIIDSYIEKGYSNLYYKRTKMEQCIDYKLIEILKDDKDILNYDYIWLINDSISILEEALTEIIKLTSEGFDLIRLPLTGGGDQSDRIYTNVEDWFHNCSQGMAHMASTIMSISLLRENTDWHNLKKMYVGSNDIYDNRHGYFFMVGFYLEQILHLSKFKGVFIGNRMKWRRDCPLKQEKSYWTDLVFSVWVRSYCETIMKLPKSYTEKEKVIKVSDNRIVGRFGERAMIGYRIHKRYTLRTFFQYRMYWSLVTSVSPLRLLFISITPIYILKKKYGANYGDASLWEERMEEIEKEIKEKKIIIYGAGLYGERVARKLQEDGFSDQIVFIAVTNTMDNVDNVLGIKVKGINELQYLKEQSLVIVATLPDTSEKIRKILKEKEFQNVVSLI